MMMMIMMNMMMTMTIPVTRMCMMTRPMMTTTTFCRRQSVRESRAGFCPNSDMAGVDFDTQTFALDLCRPRLSDMITEEEFDHYAKLRCG
jgi:hypothetical protein